MSTSVAPVVWIGTREGLLRWQAGTLTPVAGDAAVTALARLPGGRVVAGTASGELIEADRGGHPRLRSRLPQRAPIASLLALHGRDERLLGGTAAGALVEFGSEGPARAVRFDAPSAPLQVVGVPGRPRSALLVSAGHGGWLVQDPDRAPEPWFSAPTAPLLDVTPHPIDGHVWLARTATQLLRSNDGARSFRPVAGWPASLRPRRVAFAPIEPFTAFAIAYPTAEPPDPADPSPLWTSNDGGQSFHPVASRLIDHARDPVGEITALAPLAEHERVALLFATDRGELLRFAAAPSAPQQPAHLLADRMPPIEHLLAAGTAPLVDPSTSGIFLLP
ncbi:MAG: hypothetical protein JNL90_17650 [Planctomycetes bacterium]|nr:hypothetical protein [Planctomycetota bacterium]